MELALRVAAVATPCPGVRSITFRADDPAADRAGGSAARSPHGDRPCAAPGTLPSFPPGSHVGIEWAPRRMNTYSLTGPMRDPDRWHVSVALHPDGSGGSRRMHALAVGDRVRATAPRSAFPPVATAAHHLLVAGGIGVTPIVSHARWHAFWGHSFEVVYAHRPGTAPHAGDLRDLCEERLRTVTGRAELSAALGPALRAAPFNTHLYVCGPPGMIDAVTALAREAHWVDARIHTESFTPDTTPGDPFRATLRASGRTVDVAAHETLLDAVERAGVRAPSMCRQGVCGECVTRVHNGRVEHRDTVLSPAERDSSMALCVSRGSPDRDLELDL